MYLYHFGLSRLPFALSPDTSLYVELPGHRAALNTIHVALASGEGFVKVVGEVGSGKTLLCRKLLAELEGRPEVVCAYLPNPYLQPQELRLALAHELGIRVAPGAAEATLARQLELRLLHLASAGKRVVLLIDEAQALPDASLEALRLLSNLETERRKLLQILLLGQPELDARLQSPGFRQLRQRIAFAARLPRLSGSQIGAYLRQRLAAAGHGDGGLFSGPALSLLAFGSRGIPRLAQILAHKSLMLAYGRGKPRAGWAEVWAAARDTEDVALHWRRRLRPWLLLLAGLGTAGAAWAWRLGVAP
ncbi:MAG: AAA family ATPase [Gammaproteobacteria bacterium]|nr:AAA family ATPase [Gammaproteobacteria bacterium]